MARIGASLFYVAALAFAASAAQAATVKEIFEKHDLLGTFALDCTKPVSRGNYYDVHRAVDSNRVERDRMSGPAVRDFIVIWERTTENRPNEISLRGTRDGQPADAVYRAEPGRMRIMEGTVAGKKVVTGGRAANGSEMPWVYKCNAPGQQAQTAGVGSPAPAGSVKLMFEKHNLLGTFAWDCAKPVSPGNVYFVNRLFDPDHVQRDQMSGPNKRDAVSIIDRVVERKADEIVVGGTRNDEPTEGVWRLEQDRQVGVEVTIGGKKVIAGGKFVNNGQESKWLYRCRR